MKKINWFRRESELGIVFDPNCLGKGIGSSSLRNYLDIYFKIFNMKRLYLKVAKFNQRAYNSYLKVGFVEYKSVMEEFEEQGRSFEIILYHKEEFVMDKNILKTEIIYMEITRDIYYNIVNS